MRGASRMPWQRRPIVGVVAGLLSLGLVGCEIVEETAGAIADGFHAVEVVNYCAGSNATVDVYIDDTLRGAVFLRRSFSVTSGPHDFRAVGTGPYGTTFRNSAYVRESLEWTLCPVRAVRAEAVEAVGANRQMLQRVENEEVLTETP